ncbi:DUF2637 domain-containing protein [Streptomyces capparidis]
MTATRTLPSSPRPATAHRVTGWDHAAIAALGAAACALSYDALRQVASAIHVRGVLTYLFPLVIDGFIAYGVRALLVLRTAPFRARLYVWALFGTATAASVWANALHAIRLNEGPPASGLHLGDATVGVLSTAAPLALAGAVHLHILIGRQAFSGPGEADTPLLAEPSPSELELRKEPPGAGDRGTGADATVPSRRIGRPPSADLEDLVHLVRPLFRAHERPTRATVRQTIRTAGHSVSEDRLTKVMAALRTGPYEGTTPETDC